MGIYCRDTNTSVYAEVCVPAFTTTVTPVELAVKVVVDNDYCFDRVLTVCEETSTVVTRTICTYTYEKEDVVAPAQTTQVTYETKTETFKVPLVTAPLDVEVNIAYPKPVEVCVDK